MGKHLLLLLLGLSLLSGFLQALTCIQCDRVNAEGVCESGAVSCEAQGSQQCFLRKIFKGDRFQYGHQGCGDLCIPLTFNNRNVKVDFMCCSDTSFCNRL